MRRFLLLLSYSLLLVGCNAEPSLQKYFVKKSEQQNFTVLDLSPEIFNLEGSKLNRDEKSALKSFDKVNLLVFRADSTAGKSFDVESKALKSILKDKKYELLMKVGSGKDGASISYIGKDDEHIDEFVIYAAKKGNGIAVARVLGKNMNPTGVMTILSLIRKSNIDTKQLEPLKNLMKG
ncbi:DUF4252 domain-containing protein [Flavobacterium sp.]|uniref:DUF4252 domain-containing protein n=1 Tax=Flavobacterium sp. TaxID=239 RepID=UPI0026113924|nr:DUF4252 domain-containing protein [Flavobacterium sp.]